MSRQEERRAVADCVADLHEAMLDAGGDPRGLLDKTLREFCCEVAAQNEIRFVHWPTYMRQRKREEEDLEFVTRHERGHEADDVDAILDNLGEGGLGG